MRLSRSQPQPRQTSMNANKEGSSVDLAELDDLLEDLYQAKVSLTSNRYSGRSHDDISSSSSGESNLKPSSSSSSSSPISSSSTTTASSIRLSGIGGRNSSDGKMMMPSSSPVVYRASSNGTKTTNGLNIGIPYSDESTTSDRRTADGSPSSSSSTSLGSSLRPTSDRTSKNKPAVITADATRQLEDLMNSLTMYKVFKKNYLSVFVDDLSSELLIR